MTPPKLTRITAAISRTPCHCPKCPPNHKPFGRVCSKFPLGAPPASAVAAEEWAGCPGVASFREAPTRRRNILGLAGNSQISTGRRENTTLYFLNPSSASVKQRGSVEQYLPDSPASLHRPSSSSSSRQGRARRHWSCTQLHPRPIAASIAANGTAASQRLSLPSLFFFFSPKHVRIRFRFRFGFPQGVKLGGVPTPTLCPAEAAIRGSGWEGAVSATRGGMSKPWGAPPVRLQRRSANRFPQKDQKTFCVTAG